MVNNNIENDNYLQELEHKSLEIQKMYKQWKTEVNETSEAVLNENIS